MAGRVLDSGESHVETRCVHFMGLPLLPLKSYAVIDEASGASIELAELNADSVVAAYGRAWGPALAIAGLAALALGGEPVTNALCIAAGVIGGLIGWRAGRLSDDDRARYVAYRKHTRRFLDPALLGHGERTDLRDMLRGFVVDAAVAYAGKTYRDVGASPREDWESLVLAPAVTDELLLTRALTLARIETAAAHSTQEKHRFAAAHDAIWAKLVALRRPALPASQ